MHLSPSEVLYSQDSIKNRFQPPYDELTIGETLDELYGGRLVYHVLTLN